LERKVVARQGAIRAATQVQNLQLCSDALEHVSDGIQRDCAAALNDVELGGSPLADPLEPLVTHVVLVLH